METGVSVDQFFTTARADSAGESMLEVRMRENSRIDALVFYIMPGRSAELIGQLAGRTVAFPGFWTAKQPFQQVVGNAPQYR